MVEADALEMARLVGRGGGRGKMPNYCGGIYGEGEDIKKYYLPLAHNCDNSPGLEQKLLTDWKLAPESIGCSAQEKRESRTERGIRNIDRDT